MIRRARSRGLPSTTIGVALLTILLAGVTSAYGGTLTVAWDPNPDPTVMGYRVYVGTQSGVYREIYDVGNVTRFSYNAADGTTYFFTVAAYAPGPVVGPRSSEVSASAGSPGDANSFWSTVWAARSVAAGLPRLTSPEERILPSSTQTRVDPATTTSAASPDGRLFLIDGGRRRLRVMTGRGLAPESLIIAGRSTTLNQVVVDPAFAKTGVVWVGETRTSADGRRTFTVARYRVVKNRAGERTEIVPEIALPPSGDALFTIGGSGHIYVAVPGSAIASQPYWGTVLRFTVDGSVSEDPRMSSPVIGTGYTFPHAIALEPLTERVWLSGADR